MPELGKPVKGTKHCAAERKDGPSRGISSCTLGHSDVRRRQEPGPDSGQSSDQRRQQQDALARDESCTGLRGGHLCVPALGDAPRSEAAAVSQHPRPRPSQSWTNRSRGSGVRRRRGARKPGPGGLVLRLLSRVSGSGAVGERAAGGRTWMEVSDGLRLVLQRRDGPLPPERTTAWLLPDASRLLFSALWLPSSRPDADELQPLGSWLGYLSLEREPPAQGTADLGLARSSSSSSRSRGGAGR